MELKITDVKFFYSALKTMEEVDYECIIKLSSSGMEIVGIGPSRVSVFKFVLGDMGDEYESFGIDLMDFGNILKRIKNSKEIRLSYDSKLRRMKIKAIIKKKNKTFTLSEIDAKMARFPFDNLFNQPYEKTYEMLTKDLVEILRDGEICSGAVTIGIRGGILTFKSSGLISSSFIQLEEYTHDRDFGSEFGVAHLLGKITNMQSYPVSIVLGTDLPIYLNYEFPNGYLKIFVSPRITDDEDDDY